ncbi:MAG TPA: YdcF family protein [Candidatus Dormibacteraeota bacterium]|nr:YdcF family protein [Candidatus Dormibacteraeota bacterium]
MRHQIPQPGQRGACRAALVAALLLICLGGAIFLRVGHWLVREDALQKSTAVVVLSGAMPERALQAVEIYRAGYASEVWITQPTQPKRTMETLGIPFEGEEEYSRRVLVHEGVPEQAIRILSPTIVNTADEMGAIADTLKREKGTAVIVVTSKAHTRRVHALWNKLENGRGQIIVRAAAADSFDPGGWWRTTHDALDVVREILGLFNVWAGLPLKPSS